MTSNKVKIIQVDSDMSTQDESSIWWEARIDAVKLLIDTLEHEYSGKPGEKRALAKIKSFQAGQIHANEEIKKMRSRLNGQRF